MNPPELISPDDSAPAAAQVRALPRVLIVEDEGIVALDIQHRLEGLGYRVCGMVDTGEKALELAALDRPDLVLMDIRLAGPLDGIATAKELRRRFHLPVVFLTAHSEDHTLEEARRAEPFGYILKPFEDRELKSVLTLALYKHQSDEQIRRLNRLYATLSDINQTIVRTTSQPELLARVCHVTVERGGYLLAAVLLRPPSARFFQPMALAGEPADRFRQLWEAEHSNLHQPDPCQELVEQARPCVLNDLAAEVEKSPPWMAGLVELGARAGAAIPLRTADEVSGMLVVLAAEAGVFREQEVRLLEEIAEDLAYALEKLRLEEERQRAEECRRRSEAYYRTLVEQTSDLITVIDLAGWIQFQNTASLRVLGWHPAEVTGQQVFDYVHPEDVPRAMAALETLRANPERQLKLELRVRTRDGQWRVLQVQGRTLTDPEGQLRIVIDSRDVSENLKLEEHLRQTQKMEAVGRLAGGVAHDFNNILSVIMMQAEVSALMPELPPRAREALQQIRAAAERAANLSRQLLLFSRRQAFQPRPVELNALITHFTTMLRRLIGEDIHLELNLAPRALPVEADPAMLEQVLMNLAVNARDAMPRGGRLLIRTAEHVVREEAPESHPESRPGAYACLTVRDTGTGITPDVMPRIFEPFFTTKEAGKGTGLGLATVFGVVKLHQGWIDVQSEPGEGTSFQIYLPLSVQAAPPPPPAPEAVVTGGQGETVLVVEDESAVRVLLRAILERNGYRVLEAASGSEALERWPELRDQVRLLLTDLVMPGGLSGQELARQLTADRPDLKVVFLSGYSEEVVSGELSLRRGDNYIPKPFTQEQLLTTLRRRLESAT